MEGITWTVKERSDGITLTDTGSSLIIKMQAFAWRHIYLISSLFPCEERKIYKLRIDCRNDCADLRLLIQFYGQEGTMGYRYYVDPDCEISVPEGMDRFDISAVISTGENATVQLGQIHYEYIRDCSPKSVRLCSISDITIPENCKRNQLDIIAAYERSIDMVVEKERPDLIVLTEHFHNLCVPALELKDKFVDYKNEVVTRIAEKAKEHRIYISGSFHILENGCRYNRAILFDRQGKIIAEYDKTHITIVEYQMGIKPGSDIVVVDTDIGKLGFAICSDLFYPELMRLYHLAGCDILINPTRGDAQSQNYAATYTSGMFLAASGWYPVNRIQDKIGEVLDEAGDKGYAVATVDLNAPAWRPRLSAGSFFSHGRDIFKRERRPDMYDALCK